MERQCSRRPVGPSDTFKQNVLNESYLHTGHRISVHGMGVEFGARERLNTRLQWRGLVLRRDVGVCISRYVSSQFQTGWTVVHYESGLERRGDRGKPQLMSRHL